MNRKLLVIFMNLFMNMNMAHAASSSVSHQTSRTLLQEMIQKGTNPAAENPELVRTAAIAPQTQFNKTHVVLFFFASTCPYCHKQAPILKRWAAFHGMEIEARSFDDKTLPEFNEAQPVTKALVDAAYQGQAISYPALFVLNTDTHVLYPVAIGALDETELSARMDTLIPKIMAFEHQVHA